jgi:Uma2 family endonuclease
MNAQTITHINQLDADKVYSYAEYLLWKFTQRVELIKGKLLQMAAPSVYHQRIAQQLNYIVYTHFKKHRCEVFFAPFDVRLYDGAKSAQADKDIYSVVQPDIVVICNPDILSKTGCAGAPDWVIEIASPSTLQRDLYTKKDLYEANGVPEYWIILPNDQSIIAHSLVEGKYTNPKVYTTEDDVEASPALFPELKVNLLQIFES